MKAIEQNDSRHLSAYFILAYAIFWLIGIPLALAIQGITPAILPQWGVRFPLNWNYGQVRDSLK